MSILEPITTDSSEDSDSSESSPRSSAQNVHRTPLADLYYTQSYGEDAIPVSAPAHTAPIQLEKQNTASSTSSSRFNQRAQSVISRIRSREPGQVAKFTHPLSHTKTGPDVIVEFDGLDDPYHPRNWGFKKKCITTILYGLTTMGMSKVSLCGV